MAKTYKKDKIENLYHLIKIFQDHTKEKVKREVGHSNRRYLIGQYEAYEIVLTIMEKDFNLTDESKDDISV
ncbi:hypothetical protein ACN6MT_19475 [Neobacillus niacini]|uniref:hypothetical protein n=1 Tax=Neobacillus niacini TaxID=86668 RepID=UPI003B018958